MIAAAVSARLVGFTALGLLAVVTSASTEGAWTM